jgi:hypothetical protein
MPVSGSKAGSWIGDGVPRSVRGSSALAGAANARVARPVRTAAIAERCIREDIAFLL